MIRRVVAWACKRPPSSSSSPSPPCSSAGGRSTPSTSRPTPSRLRRSSSSSASRWGGARTRSSGSSPCRPRWASPGMAGPGEHPLPVHLRSQRREGLLQVGHHLRRGPAGGDQPHRRLDHAAAGDHRRHLPVERHRRGVPLQAQGQGLHPRRAQVGGRLDHGEELAHRARRRRRHQLRRLDQAVPGRGRPDEAARLRADHQPGDERHHQRQPERGRRPPLPRRAGVRHPRHRPGEERPRHREDRHRRGQRHPGPRRRRGRGEDRPRAAARRRGHRRRAGRGAGHRPDALRRADACPRWRASTRSSTRSRRTTCCRRGWRSRSTTTAARSPS